MNIVKYAVCINKKIWFFKIIDYGGYDSRLHYEASLKKNIIEGLE